jgi:hypothetical protein
MFDFKLIKGKANMFSCDSCGNKKKKKCRKVISIKVIALGS